jgi:hypothetical protein
LGTWIPIKPTAFPERWKRGKPWESYFHGLLNLLYIEHPSGLLRQYIAFHTNKAIVFF